MSTDSIGLFDLDGSLANYDKAVLDKLAVLKCPDEPMVEDVREALRIPHLRARIDLICREPNWWVNLEPIAMGFQILEIAKQIGFQIHVLTQGPKNNPVAWKEKVEWCQKYLGSDIDIHITRNKGLVYGKFLYDDYPDYMLRWLAHRPRGLGIMPVNTANRDFQHPQVIRWDGTNTDEVVERLQTAYQRRAGEPWPE
jgi:5' nucleotidase, deoxy (Pyrimidine), cytosolic type C protein (NT5C)